MTAAALPADPVALLGHEGLFRFAYVPFVVAEAAWDQADTLLDIAAQQRLGNKPLCRAVRALRRDYAALRSRFIDEPTLRSEARNMDALLGDLAGFFSGLNHTLRNELAAQFPDLSEASRLYLAAVYTARVTADALLRYVKAQTDALAAKMGRAIDGRIMPPHVYRLAELLPAFCGDSEMLPVPGDHDPRRRRFAAVYDSFVRALTNKINAIQLNDTEPPTP